MKDTACSVYGSLISIPYSAAMDYQKLWNLEQAERMTSNVVCFLLKDCTKDCCNQPLFVTHSLTTLVSS